MLSLISINISDLYIDKHRDGFRYQGSGKSLNKNLPLVIHYHLIYKFVLPQQMHMLIL